MNNLDILTTSEKIEEKIKLLEQGRALLQKRAIDKANAIAEYDKQITITILKLRNGETIEFDDKEIVNPPVTIIEKIAKGICYKYLIKKDLAESQYRNAVIGMDSIKAEMNGYQSINRFLDQN
jgi:hypothetical protein